MSEKIEEFFTKRRPEHIPIPLESRKEAIKKILEQNPGMESHTKEQMIKQMERNGRWGTCADCPSTRKDNEYNIFPENCPNTDRYDHWLGVDALEEEK